MNANVLASINAHAVAEYPREACGVVIIKHGVENYIPCRNIARTAQEHFIMEPADYADAEDMGDVIAIVHSHPDAASKPSEADLVMCERTGLEWHIVSVGVDGPHDMTSIMPSGYVAPLVGRSFSHGVLDCYTLIRDWYERERGITLPDFERRDDWWKNGEDLYMENFTKAGFTPLSPGEPVEEGDVILMQLRSKKVNHGAIYVGDGKILHHMVGRLSSRDVYDGWFQEMTRLIVRHRGVVL